jgi:hypothetical protein
MRSFFLPNSILPSIFRDLLPCLVLGSKILQVQMEPLVLVAIAFASIQGNAISADHHRELALRSAQKTLWGHSNCTKNGGFPKRDPARRHA